VGIVARSVQRLLGRQPQFADNRQNENGYISVQTGAKGELSAGILAVYKVALQSKSISGSMRSFAVAFALTSEVSDFSGYLPVMDGDRTEPNVLPVDKGDGADFVREDMEPRGCMTMISTKRNRLIHLPVDAAL
jgi:hypothetical protein